MYTYVCVWIYMYVCIYVCTYVYMCVYVCMCNWMKGHVANESKVSRQFDGESCSDLVGLGSRQLNLSIRALAEPGAGS